MGWGNVIQFVLSSTCFLHCRSGNYQREHRWKNIKGDLNEMGGLFDEGLGHEKFKGKEGREGGREGGRAGQRPREVEHKGSKV